MNKVSRKCLVTDCDDKHHAKGYCDRHYKHLSTYGRIKDDSELKREFKHGLKKHPLYVTWESMRKRCNNPNYPAYKNYGGRGIKVCERWDNFANFLEDMGERPEGMTLDRKHNDKNYEKSNCRWATQLEQVANRRMSTTNKSSFKWVSINRGCKNRPYVAVIGIGTNKAKFFGHYATPEEAAYVADQVKIQLSGENIPLNFLGNKPIYPDYIDA